MKNILVSSNLKIIRAMKKLAQTGERCLIVVDSQKKLLGTITDGDIRRGILEGLSIDQSIKSIYSRKPIILEKDKYSIEDARNLLRIHKQILLPIVGKKNIVVGYLSWEQVFGTRKKDKSLISTQVVIMAGGKGGRLAPFTKVLPKPLIPINEKPVIEHIIEKFTSFGVKNFFVTVNYKSRILKSFFLELQPSYSVKFFDEIEPLGTVGGLKSHKKKFRGPFFVTNCDIIIDADYKDILNFHKIEGYDITLVASPKKYSIPYGMCELDKNGHLSNIREKPSYNFLANTGLYVLNPNVLKLIPRNKPYHMTELIKQAKKKKLKIGIYPIESQKWIDIGQWNEYKKTLERM